MELDPVSAETLAESRGRLVQALLKALDGGTYENYRKRVEELVDSYTQETREVCVLAVNTRTGEKATRRIDFRGIVPSSENVDELLRLGAQLWGHGWDMITETDIRVKITRSGLKQHPMTRTK